MNPKQIEHIIKKKVSEWVASIDDSMGVIKNSEIMDSVIVTGGCIPSMLTGQKVNDFDIYFQQPHIVVSVAQHYVKQFNQLNNPDPEASVVEQDGRVRVLVKSKGFVSEGDREQYKYFEGYDEGDNADYFSEVARSLQESVEAKSANKELRYRPIFITDNAITLSDKVQLVLRFHGSPDQIHKNYDFVHCTNYWTKKDGLVLRPDAMKSILARELFYVRSEYPVASILRARKYINRGWKINVAQYLKMVFQVHDLDLGDPEVLMDQLVGVDVAYLHELITKLSDKKKEEGFKITTPYICTLIDRMYGL